MPERIAIHLTPLQAQVLLQAIEFVLTADDAGRAYGFTRRDLGRLFSTQPHIQMALQQSRETTGGGSDAAIRDDCGGPVGLGVVRVGPLRYCEECGSSDG